MKNRSKYDLIAEILHAVAPGKIIKTHIMYRACLSVEQVEEYVAESVESGLISYSNREYGITEKGIEFLELYHKIDGMLRLECGVIAQR